MIKSMTGFASLTREGDSATVTVAAKGVNHRFLDLQLRMPAALSPIEAKLRGIAQQKVARGRLEVTISLQTRAAAAPVQVEVNEAVIESLSSALERARERGLVAGALTPGDLLRFPQAITVTETRETMDPAVFGEVEAAFADTLDGLDGMRTSEGEHLRADLDARRASAAIS